MNDGTMNHDVAVSIAREIADRVLAPAATQNDKQGRFSAEAVEALGKGGLLGLTLPIKFGGGALGPRTFAGVTAALAEADASAAMVYLIHVCAAATIVAARSEAAVAETLKEMASGQILATLAFSEAGSRSHFWAPVSRATRNGASVRLTANKSWVTSAGYAHCYVVSSLAPDGKGPTESTLYLVPAQTPGLSVAGPWDGLGLRANASAPMVLEACAIPSGLQLTEDGAGFQAMMNVVLPLFNLGTAAVALGLCRAAVAATARHLNTARFEHLGQSLGESLPTLRAHIAEMQIDTDGLAARINDLIDHLEQPRDTTLLRVLATKAAAATSQSMSLQPRCASVVAPRSRSIPASNGCFVTRMPARSWHRPETFCVNLSDALCSDCRCSDYKRGATEEEIATFCYRSSN
jgi:alkylation response protein AidB-like acyl-CoA dehydrogenase